MKRKLQSKRVRMTLIVLGFAIAGLASVVSQAIPSGGPWTLSARQDCQGPNVCADWDLDAGSPWATCCISPQDLGSSHATACKTGFRHAHDEE